MAAGQEAPADPMGPSTRATPAAPTALALVALLLLAGTVRPAAGASSADVETRVHVANAVPVVDRVRVPASVGPADADDPATDAEAAVPVPVRVEVRDANGCGDVVAVAVELWAPNGTLHRAPDGANRTVCTGAVSTWEATFILGPDAPATWGNSTYRVLAVVRDAANATAAGDASFRLLGQAKLEVAQPTVEFGTELAPGTVTPAVPLRLRNGGTVPLTVTLHATELRHVEVPGAAIPTRMVRVADGPDMAGAEPLPAPGTPLVVDVPVGATRTLYFQVHVPDGGGTGGADGSGTGGADGGGEADAADGPGGELPRGIYRGDLTLGIATG